jgi:hypothetical protein
VWRLVHGQWMIWSAASVISGDLTSGRQKLRDRMAGALVGVPPGIGAGILLQHSAFARLAGRRADIGRGAPVCAHLRSALYVRRVCPDACRPVPRG